MAEKTLYEQWEKLIEDAVDEAVRSGEHIMEIFGERGLFEERLSPLQELELYTQLLESDESLIALASQMNLPEIMAIRRRQRELAERMSFQSDRKEV